MGTPYLNFRAKLRHPFLQKALFDHLSRGSSLPPAPMSAPLEVLYIVVDHLPSGSRCLQCPLPLCCSATWASSFMPLSLSFLLSRMRMMHVMYAELLDRLNEMAYVEISPSAGAPSKHSDVSSYNLRTCMTLDCNRYLNLTISSLCMSCVTVGNYICVKYMKE